MLSIAYAASIGGIATLIGNTTQLFLPALFNKTYGIETYILSQWDKIWIPYIYCVYWVLLGCINWASWPTLL